MHSTGCDRSASDFRSTTSERYSNLRSLERFPVTEIKIDRTFVSELATNPSKRVIVRAVIDLGHALGLTVVAEGVETEAQRAMLVEMGCPVGQGYLLEPPPTQKASQLAWP
jgi:EAL domain-containing protein (putative c-di-GMP-specific phosphodiesterase class I)